MTKEGKRHAKPTRAQVLERIEFTRELLLGALHTGQIKKALAEKFGITAYRTVADYIARARTVMLEDIKEDPAKLRAQAIGRYEKVLRDKDASCADKIRAQERIDRLFGLDAPIMQRQSVEVNATSTTTVIVTEKELPNQELARLMERASRAMLPFSIDGNGHAHTNGNGNGHAVSSEVAGAN